MPPRFLLLPVQLSAAVSWTGLAGESTSRVEMTESGFMRLVGGFNGRQVSLLRERYIKQWNVSWRTSCFGCAPRQRRPHRGVSHRSFSSANWQIFLERMRIAQVLNKRNQWATVCETYL